MKIETVIVSLDDVLSFYAKAFQTTEGNTIRHRGETLIDTEKRKVVFQLYLENGDTKRPNNPTAPDLAERRK